MAAAELSPPETPATFGTLPGEEGLEKVVHEAASRIGRRLLTAGFPLELGPQHLLGDRPVPGVGGTIVRAPVRADPLDPIDLPTPVDVAFRTPPAPLTLHQALGVNRWLPHP